MSDPFFIPARLYITERLGGTYNGGLDWPNDKPRQEPDTFRRRPIIGLLYREYEPWMSSVYPSSVVMGDGSIRPADSHWLFGISPDPDLTGHER